MFSCLGGGEDHLLGRVGLRRRDLDGIVQAYAEVVPGVSVYPNQPEPVVLRVSGPEQRVALLLLACNLDDVAAGQPELLHHLRVDRRNSVSDEPRVRLGHPKPRVLLHGGPGDKKDKNSARLVCEGRVKMKKAPRRGRLAFVVQKHKATSLHYDFRLEIGGVMPSWSVPKGPSLDSGVRRLAMPTSDHLMEYRHFEGVLKGEYGAGPVMIWDEGTYNPEVEVSKGVRREVVGRERPRRSPQKSLKEGNLKFRLYGKKLQGLLRAGPHEGVRREGVVAADQAPRRVLQARIRRQRL